MKKILLFFILIIASFFLFKEKANALSRCPVIDCAITVTFCNANPTDWHVYAYYCDSSVNPTCTNSGGKPTGSGWYLITSDHSTKISNPSCSSGVGWTSNNIGNNQAPDSGDKVLWHQACVDPAVNVNADVTYRIKQAGYNEYETIIDSACHAMGTNGTPNRVYAGCYNNQYSTYNHGSVGAGAQCPYFDSNTSYCTKGGLTAYSTSCGASYCGGTGSCTYYNKTCSGTSCTHPSTAYSTNCGGAAISGTSMCTTTPSYTCSPPAPVVTATTSCSGTTPIISTNWTAPSYSNGAYDLRWRVAGGSFTNVCTPAKPFVISSGLTSGTTYEVQVRGNTTAGHNGPTAFGSDTVVAASCIPPPTCSLAASPTSIYQGQTSALTTTGAVGAGGGSLTYSYPAPSTGTTDAVTTSTSTYHAPATVASNTTATVYAKTCNSIGGACTTCSRTITVTATNSITAHVYQDLNGNAVQDAAEPDYSGGKIAVSGLGSSGSPYTTDANGDVVMANLLTGSSTLTLTIPSGWRLTTANNPKTLTLPPSQTVNFGIQPPAPVCSGGLTANPTTLAPGDTSRLTANGCTGGQNANLTYTWLTPAPGSITSTNPSTVNTAIWTAPNPYWTDIYAYPTVSVCITGTSLCTPYAISNGVGINNSGIHIVPLFSISGNVFTDQNKDKLQNGADANYTGGITITPNPVSGSIVYNNGNYTISNLRGGSYTIAYTSLPAGYMMTNPVNGPPPTFTVRIGNASTGGACSVGGSNSAACDVNGNITALRYGISNSIPWIQCVGGDCTGGGVTNPGGGGFTDPIPQGATCGVYASLVGSGGTPGIIYSGAGSYNFGSGQASTNPYNWVIGGLSYPEPIKITSPLITSYSYVYSTSQASGTINDITSYCGAGGLSSCHLPANLPNGFYRANGNLTLTGSAYTFPGNTSSPKNFIIMVNGDLTIQTEIHTPVGDTAFFTASGNINVGQTVGEATITSTRSNVEGYFSTDKSFYVQGNNACPTSDLRLNVAGSIVVNASLTGGTFVNQRDLCAGDLQCPAFSVIERADFVLYAPEYLRVRRVWQEVAP